MRKRFPVLLAANGRWPDGQTGGVNRPFNWVKIDNRGTGSVDVGLNAKPTAGDLIDTLLTVQPGSCRVFNVAGPDRNPQDTTDAWPDQLWLVSTAGTTVLVEVADHPIVDLGEFIGSIQGLPTLNSANSTIAAGTVLAEGAELYVWNGASWDQVTEITAGNLNQQQGNGGIQVAPPGEWAINNSPAVNNAASISKAARAAFRHVATRVSFSFSASAALAGATSCIVNLRDGASGAGTVLQSWQFALAAAVIAPFAFSLPVNIPGSVNTAMTLEFGAGVTGLLTSVDLCGYDAF